MSSLKIQYVAFAPDGVRLGLLPYPLSASSADVINDLGAGTLDYLADVPQAKYLEDLCEIAVEIHNGTTWVEPGARLLRLGRSASTIEETKTRRYTLPSYGMMCAKIRMFREELLDDNGDRPFAGITVGTFLKTLIDESKGRGNVPGLLYSFTTATDSAGVSWGGNMPARSLRYGDDLLTQLRSMADEGLIDWTFVGRELRVYVAEGLGTTKPVTLTSADITEAPDTEDGTEMAGRIGVVGDNGRIYEAIAPSVGPWGLWEELATASGVQDIGGLQLIGQVEQERRSAPRVQMTRQLQLVAAQYLPHVHYGVGDTITAPNDRGVASLLRVRQITLTLGRDGVGANLVLNDRFVEKSIRQGRAVKGLMGSASSSVGTGGTPAAPGDDKRPPKAPAGLVVNSEGLWNTDGAAFSVLSASWAAVTEATDSSAIDVDRYEVYSRLSTEAAIDSKLLTATAATTITDSPYEPGSIWFVKVRARSRSGVWGAFSAEMQVTMALPLVPLDPPTDPILSCKLSVVTARWDGELTTGFPPAQFVSVYAAISDAQGGIYVPEGNNLGHAGGVTISGHARGTTVWVQFYAVDRNGVVSAPSAPVSIIVVGVEGPDLEANSVTANALAVGTVQAEHISLGARMPLGESNQRVPSPVTDSAFWGKVFDGTIDLVTPPVAAPQSLASVVAGGIRLAPNATDPARAWLTARQAVPVSRALNCAFLASGVTSLVRTNGLANPSGRRSLAQYTGFGGTPILDPGNGTYVDAPGTLSGLNLGLFIPRDVDVSLLGGGGQTWTFSADVLATLGAPSALLGVSGTGVVATVNSTPSSPGVWTRRSVTFTTAASGLVNFAIANGGTTPAGGRIAFRDALLERGTVAGSYFDGNTPSTAATSYAWTGLVDASTSTATTPTISVRVASWDAAGTATISTVPSGQTWSFPGDAVEYAACLEQAAGAGVATVATATVFEVIGRSGNGQQSAQLTPDGLRLISDDGSGVVDLTTASSNFLSIRKLTETGLFAPVTTFDSDGGGQVVRLTVNDDINVRGTALLGGFDQILRNGAPDTVPIIDRRAAGVLTSGFFTLPSGAISSAYRALAVLQFSARAGRRYKFSIQDNFSCRNAAAVGAAFLEILLSSSPIPVNATTGYVTLRRTGLLPADGVRFDQLGMNLSMSVGAGVSPTQLNDGTNYVLVRIRNTGSSQFSMFADSPQQTVAIEDIGPAVGTFLDFTDATSVGTPVAQPTRRTDYIDASWSESHNSGGGVNPTSGNLYTDGRMVQGGGTGGARVSYVGFPPLNLAGRQIQSMRLRLRNRHTAAASGAAVQLGANSLTTAPGSLQARTWGWDASTAKGEDKWYDVPANLYGMFASGSLRCISLGDRAAGSNGNYCIFDSVSDTNALGGGAVNPQLEIVSQ